jgi:sulfite reductase (ferredoxin)
LRIGTTARQKFVIVDVEETETTELAARLDELDLPSAPGSFRKGVMACTGIEFCKLAIGETKGRARWLAEELDRRLPGLEEEIRIHVNGCPNSCARFQVADIGLMSALARRPDGTKSDAFLVHLGGGMGDEASFGRKVKGVRVFAEDAADYVETLVKRYRGRRGPEEPSFTDFVRGMDDDELTVFATPEAGR